MKATSQDSEISLRDKLSNLNALSAGLLEKPTFLTKVLMNVKR